MRVKESLNEMHLPRNLNQSVSLLNIQALGQFWKEQLYRHSILFARTETETQNNSGCLDFLSWVQICISVKTQISTESVSRFSRTDLGYRRENLDTMSVHVLKKMRIWTHLRKSRWTE